MTCAEPSRRPSAEQLLLNPLFSPLKKVDSMSMPNLRARDTLSLGYLSLNSLKNSMNAVKKLKTKRAIQKELKCSLIGNANGLMKQSFLAPTQEGHASTKVTYSFSGEMKGDDSSILFDSEYYKKVKERENFSEENVVANEDNGSIQHNIK